MNSSTTVLNNSHLLSIAQGVWRVQSLSLRLLRFPALCEFLEVLALERMCLFVMRDVSEKLLALGTAFPDCSKFVWCARYTVLVTRFDHSLTLLWRCH